MLIYIFLVLITDCTLCSAEYGINMGNYNCKILWVNTFYNASIWWTEQGYVKHSNAESLIASCYAANITPICNPYMVIRSLSHLTTADLNEQLNKGSPFWAHEEALTNLLQAAAQLLTEREHDAMMC